MTTVIEEPPASVEPEEIPERLRPALMYMSLLRDFGEEINGPKSLLYKIATWNVLLKVLQWLEENTPIMDSEEGLSTHRDLTEIVISLGITLQREVSAKNVVLCKSDHGTTSEEFHANLAWLRDKLSMWHGDVTPKRKAAVFESLFGDASAA